MASRAAGTHDVSPGPLAGGDGAAGCWRSDRSHMTGWGTGHWKKGFGIPNNVTKARYVRLPTVSVAPLFRQLGGATPDPGETFLRPGKLPCALHRCPGWDPPAINGLRPFPLGEVNTRATQDKAASAFLHCSTSSTSSKSMTIRPECRVNISALRWGEKVPLGVTAGRFFLKLL